MGSTSEATRSADAESASRWRIASWGLPGPSSCAGPSIELCAGELADLCAWVQWERLEGLYRAAIEGGALTVDDEELGRAGAEHLAALRTTLAAEAVAAEVTQVLASAHVESRLLKGLAAAHLDYPDPALRTSVDADVLVRRSELPTAIAALERAGFDRPPSGTYAGWERRYARAVMLQSPEPVEVDLHAAIAVGYFGTHLEETPELMNDGDPFDLGGVVVHALAPAARLISSCYALVLSRGPHVRLMRDVAQQLLVTECDWRATAALAAAADGEAVVARAVLDTAAQLPVPSDHPSLQWAREVKPSRVARRALDYAALGEQRGWAADARSTMLALGPVDRVRFVLGAGLRPRRRRHAG